MRDSLPLATLPAFEAAARNSSFKLAASELNLSQAAVSRQIKHLEDRLGVSLFERHHRAISLTENGEQLYRTAGVALRLLSETVQSLRPEKSSDAINIATDLAFAHFWLIPRLDLFRHTGAEGDQTTISVTVSDDEADCLAPGVDLPILYGDGTWPGYEARMVMDEEIFPVCSPGYLEQLGPVETPEDLLDGTLLHVIGGPDTWVTWSEWFANHDVVVPPNQGGIELNSLPWTIQVACAGQGVALGWKYLADDLLRSGALVRPIPHTMRTERSYYVLLRAGSPMREQFERISRWITDLVRDSNAAT